MTATYNCIATTTVTSSQANVEFTSISGSYTDLVLIVNGILSSANPADVMIRFNGDTGSNYSITEIYGNGSTVTSSRTTSATACKIAFVSTGYNLMIRLNIQNYSNTTTNKTLVSRNDTTSNVAGATVGLYRSTSAITSLTIFASPSGNITAGTYSLYGVKAE